MGSAPQGCIAVCLNRTAPAAAVPHAIAPSVPGRLHFDDVYHVHHVHHVCYRVFYAYHNHSTMLIMSSLSCLSHPLLTGLLSYRSPRNPRLFDLDN
ncbi:hypothetical protein GRF29_77g514763 [Pseudopithomyces chartarum]|uniref:Uncharacterized protein n=1 Tax=Pseudopithomyces chartarum TaxID=1892770 RepID=A0AAN6RH10_9PLEO|nr:hypothetical protein GRF29_77g514763 [Pseudopithomyces chartarum]